SDRNPAAWEWIWALPFDKSFAPKNPFIDLFSPVGGSYLLKPSQEAIDNWNSQTQRNGFPFDARGRFTYRTIGGRPVVMKYLYNYINADGIPLLSLNDRNGKWFLYRAATMHLHYAEAANRDGRHKIAWALVNNGINAAFDDPNNPDKTNSQQTHDVPPYDFMARSGGTPGTPTFTDPWYRGTGIRGRAYVTNLPVAGDSTLAIEDMIINEGALETAYEGHRWSDLLRVAMRRNDPSYLADKVYAKLQKDGVPNAAQARAKLMAGDWYLPFKW
ncbi:MAG TPA: RagB/SusD family nutrient uptake outer membrane protein, partial [Chitinophagaceae bacterium]|nr:RagB/SusD family nutrient uptake outer membrane protein [Chitinophagaceae bacterium]